MILVVAESFLAAADSGLVIAESFAVRAEYHLVCAELRSAQTKFLLVMTESGLAIAENGSARSFFSNVKKFLLK